MYVCKDANLLIFFLNFLYLRVYERTKQKKDELQEKITFKIAKTDFNVIFFFQTKLKIRMLLPSCVWLFRPFIETTWCLHCMQYFNSRHFVFMSAPILHRMLSNSVGSNIVSFRSPLECKITLFSTVFIAQQETVEVEPPLGRHSWHVNIIV